MRSVNRDYAESRIREALKANAGNSVKTRQQIIAWALDDMKLLQELVAPHLTGITAHAVNRVMMQKEKAEPVTMPSAAIAANKDVKGDQFGLEILKAIALGNPAQFGLENGVSPKRQAASQQHIDAIRQMVSKDKTRR